MIPLNYYSDHVLEPVTILINIVIDFGCFYEFGVTRDHI
jgi:hypothetical protein